MTDEAPSNFVDELSRFVSKYRPFLVGVLVTLIVVEIGLLFLQEISRTQGWTLYAPPHITGIIEDIAFDQEGRAWVVSKGDTMVYPLEGDPIPVPFIETVNKDALTAAAFDPQDRLWVGTTWGLVYARDRDGTWTHFSPDKEMNSYHRLARVDSIVIDQEGLAWFNTFEGIWTVDYAAGEIDYPFGGLYRSSGVAIDGSGTIYANDRGNVTIQSAGEPVELPGDHPGRNIAVDNLGRVWGGYSNRVFFHTEDANLAVFPLTDDPIDSTILTIKTDSRNRVWAGSNHGIFVVDPEGGVTQYQTRNSGIPGSWVYDIELDQAGDVWIATNQGVAEFNETASSPLSRNKALRSLRNGYLPALLTLLGILLASPSFFSQVRPTAARPKPFEYILIGSASLALTCVIAILFQKATLLWKKPLPLYLVPTLGALAIAYFKGTRKGIVSVIYLELLLYIVEIAKLIYFILITIFFMIAFS